MTSDRDQIVAALEEMAQAPTGPNDRIIPPGQRPCPICTEHMQVEEFSGILIDTCPKHGVWLDASELPLLLAKARQGESCKRVEAVRKANRQGKMAGILLGTWSLLLD